MEFQIKNVKPMSLDPVNFKINWENISTIYAGKLNSCACGCGGNYFYTQNYANYRAETDGNRLLLDEVSDEVDLFIQNIITEKFLNSSDVKYMHSGNEWILEVETSSRIDEYNDEVIKGYRIYSNFNPFKI